MEIKDVKLNHIPAVTESVDENGLGQTTHGDLYSFEIVGDNDMLTIIPNDPNNARYWEVKAWYDAQEVKPFDFTFEELPEPDFAETIYPSVQEEAEESADIENTNIETEDI